MKKNMQTTKPKKTPKAKRHSRPVSYAFKNSKHAQPLGILTFPR